MSMQDDKKVLPSVVPIFPLTGAILLPSGQLPLNIFEPRYLNMVDDALRTNRMIAMVQPKPDTNGMQDRPDIYPVGGLGRLTSFAETDDDRYIITLTGVSRIEIRSELTVATPYRQAEVSYDRFGDDIAPSNSLNSEGFDRDMLLDALRRYFDVNKIQSDWQAIVEAPADGLVNSLSMIAPVEAAEKQALLEADSVADRADVLIALIELALADQTGATDRKPN